MVNRVLLGKAYNELGFSISRDSRDILDFLFYFFRHNNKLNNLIVFENKVYQWISVKKLISEFQFSRSKIEKIIKNLVSDNFLFKILDKSNNMYLSINFDKYKTIFNMKEKYCVERVNWINNYLEKDKLKLIKKINSYNKNGGDKVLISEEDLGIKKESKKKEKTANPKYSKEAYCIAVKIINKSKKENKPYFRHEVKEYNDVKRSDLFDFACNSIQAIYKGNFLNSKHHELSEKFLHNGEFPINLSETRKILKEVEGDWNKVRKLVLNAYNNFEIMHKDDYCPTNKRFLTKVISEWFYGYSDEAGKYQSQFIQCLFEIPLTKKYYSEKKADNIFEKLNGKSQDYGEKLIDLNPKMNSGTAWENIKKMVEWAKLLLTSDSNAGYWIASPSEIIIKFVNFAEERNLQINTNSFDIEWCVNNNGPWVWFLEDAIKKHNLNSNIKCCVNSDDFVDCFAEKGPSFDDMEDVVF